MGAVVGLAVVRSLRAPRSLTSARERQDFEQDLADQFLLAAVGDVRALCDRFGMSLANAHVR